MRAAQTGLSGSLTSWRGCGGSQSSNQSLRRVTLSQKDVLSCPVTGPPCGKCLELAGEEGPGRRESVCPGPPARLPSLWGSGAGILADADTAYFGKPGTDSIPLAQCLWLCKWRLRLRRRQVPCRGAAVPWSGCPQENAGPVPGTCLGKDASGSAWFGPGAAQPHSPRAEADARTSWEGPECLQVEAGDSPGCFCLPLRTSSQQALVGLFPKLKAKRAANLAP